MLTLRDGRTLPVVVMEKAMVSKTVATTAIATKCSEFAERLVTNALGTQFSLKCSNEACCLVFPGPRRADDPSAVVPSTDLIRRNFDQPPIYDSIEANAESAIIREIDDRFHQIVTSFGRRSVPISTLRANGMKEGP